MARVAVVTGGTRGIGHAISTALRFKGFRVAANYAGNDAAARQFQADTGIPVYKWDVGDYAQCQEGVARITRDLGPIDVLVNNAGITRDAMLHRMTKDNWDAVIRTDLDSVFNMTRLVIDSMRSRGFGRIINISSINGRKGQMGQAVPKEVLDTKIIPLIPVGRLGTAEEIARCVTFLAADEAGFITGSCIDANGGQYIPS